MVPKVGILICVQKIKVVDWNYNPVAAKEYAPNTNPGSLLFKKKEKKNVVKNDPIVYAV